MSVLPNPAIDAFREKLKSQTKAIDAISTGREELIKAKVQQGLLHAKWTTAMGQLFFVIFAWETFHLIEYGNAKTSAKNAETFVDADKFKFIVWSHSISAALALVTAFGVLGAAYLKKIKGFKVDVKQYTNVFFIMEVAIVCFNYYRGHYSNIAIEGKPVVIPMTPWPFASILVCMKYAQDLYMDSASAKSLKDFNKVDEIHKKLQLEEKKKKSK